MLFVWSPVNQRAHLLADTYKFINLYIIYNIQSTYTNTHHEMKVSLSIENDWTLITRLAVRD